MPRRKYSKAIKKTDPDNEKKKPINQNMFSALSAMDSDDDMSDCSVNSVVSDNSSNKDNNKDNHKSADKETDKNNDNDDKEPDVFTKSSHDEVKKFAESSASNDRPDDSVYVAPSGSADGWSYVSGKKKGRRNRYRRKSPMNPNKKIIDKTEKHVFDVESATPEKLEAMGDNKTLNSKWTVSVHNNDNDDWTIDSYDHIYDFDTIGSFWRFFNNFHLLDKISNDIFIMRDGITPIWEDLNNRSGGICSLKIDYHVKGGRNEIGSEIMLCLCMLMINESLVPENGDINGISYAIRNRSIFIKIWVKDYDNNEAFPDDMPQELIKKIKGVLNMYDSRRSNGREKLTKKYYRIVPEYSL